MKLKDILKDIEVVELRADPDMEIGDICYDSRTAKAGDLFVAIAGFETDGHKYINAALEKGAVAVLCQRPPEAEAPCVLVSDSRLALAIASRNFFRSPSSEMVMIGVTGTNGKTTTTTLIKHMLEHCLGAKVGLVGTNQNMIGYTALPAERTTPESYELQKLLRRWRTRAAAMCDEVSPIPWFSAGWRDKVPGWRVHEPDPGPPGLPRHDGGARQGKGLLFSQCDRGAVNLDDHWAEFMLKEARCPMLTFAVKRNEADLVARTSGSRQTGEVLRPYAAVA